MVYISASMYKYDLGCAGTPWTSDLDINLIKIISSISPQKYPLDGSSRKKLQVVLEPVYARRSSNVDVNDVLGWNIRKKDCRILAQKIDKHQKGSGTRTPSALRQRIERLFGYKDFSKKCNICNIKVYTGMLYEPLPVDFLRDEEPLTHGSFLLGSKSGSKRKILHIRRQIGLEWIRKGQTALYVYPNLEEVDYAQMFLEILGFLKQRGESLDSLLKKRANQKTHKLYEVFLDQQYIRLEPKLFVHLGRSSISIITSLFLVELYYLLNELTNKSLVSDSIYVSTLHSFQSLISIIENLQGQGKLNVGSAISFLRISRETISVVLEPVDGKDCISSSEVDRINQKINDINKMVSGLSDTQPTFPPFYIVMSTLFELYVYVTIENLSTGTVYKPQYQHSYGKWPEISTPDISVFIQGKVAFLIDAKYKKSYCSPGSVTKKDIQQLKTFIDRSGVKQIYLAYPAAKGINNNDDKSITLLLSGGQRVMNCAFSSQEEVYVVPMPLPIMSNN